MGASPSTSPRTAPSNMLSTSARPRLPSSTTPESSPPLTPTVSFPPSTARLSSLLSRLSPLLLSPTLRPCSHLLCSPCCHLLCCPCRDLLTYRCRSPGQVCPCCCSPGRQVATHCRSSCLQLCRPYRASRSCWSLQCYRPEQCGHHSLRSHSSFQHRPLPQQHGPTGFLLDLS